jgi:hypothetical protein
VLLAVVIGLIVLCGLVLWYRNSFTVLELLLLWLFISTTNQILLASLSVNLKHVKMTETLQAFCAMHSSAIFLIPLIIVLFIDLYSGSSSPTRKGVWILLFTLLLTGTEYGLAWGGLFKHANWQLWWSGVCWLSMLCLALGCNKFVRYLIRNSGDAYDRLSS